MRAALLVVMLAALAGAASATAAAHTSTPVPVLAYHVVGDPPAGAPQPGLYVSVADFRAQLDWLARHGCRPVTIECALAALGPRHPLPPKSPVTLTFDNSYPERRRRRAATAPRAPLAGDAEPAHRQPDPGERDTTLIAAGWEIDAHTSSRTTT